VVLGSTLICRWSASDFFAHCFLVRSALLLLFSASCSYSCPVPLFPLLLLLLLLFSYAGTPVFHHFANLGSSGLASLARPIIITHLRRRGKGKKRRKKGGEERVERREGRRGKEGR
jgi:hypothetical protein